ncbi:hypothetical protein [Paenibacillus lemnae]|uniref:Uncharacterized protein n=1 Tax=Paenibacillus lemnae TaxID=1330551 RepID=A0A848MDQ7_PAELE|nr:hypothetical protein [Paenibacillus lemnae]NMO98182.1 hypothetical protein [Paenibacillus lemnae]
MKDIATKYYNGFESLLNLQNEVEEIHPLLTEHYPIAIVEDEHFYIYEYQEAGYRLTHIEPDTMNIPIGVRAAFPLECMQYQAVVVVTGEVFDTVKELIVVFHEFVHCYQYHTCEMDLRKQIELAKRSLNSESYSWELDYPFPYTNNQYIQLTKTLLESIEKKDLKQIGAARRKLKECLTSEQVEYMVWQEWKEGFARYIENRLNAQLGINQNHWGKEEPYGRPTFYEVGSRLIDLIVKASPSSLYRIDELYYALNSDQYFQGREERTHDAFDF